MMDEELHLQPVQTRDILRTAVVVGIATLIGHLIPLLPFFVLPRTPALIVALVLSGFALFGVGAYTAVSLVGDWRKSGLKFRRRPRGRGDRLPDRAPVQLGGCLRMDRPAARVRDYRRRIHGHVSPATWPIAEAPSPLFVHLAVGIPSRTRWVDRASAVASNASSPSYPIADISSELISIIASISAPPVRRKRQTRTAARARKTTLRTEV